VLDCYVLEFDNYLYRFRYLCGVGITGIVEFWNFGCIVYLWFWFSSLYLYVVFICIVYLFYYIILFITYFCGLVLLYYGCL